MAVRGEMAMAGCRVAMAVGNGVSKAVSRVVAAASRIRIA